MDQYVDRSTKEAWGDPRRGARLYQTVCSMCHGFDGKEINFGDEKKLGRFSEIPCWAYY